MGWEETIIVGANAVKNKIPYPHFISPSPERGKVTIQMPAVHCVSLVL